MARWTTPGGEAQRQIWWVEDLALGTGSRDFATPGAACREMRRAKYVDPVLRSDVQTLPVPSEAGESDQ